jgi:molybdate transport system permease protein
MEDFSPLYTSIKTASVSTIITFFIGIYLAWKIGKWKNKTFWDTLFTLPMILPPTVLGFFLLLIFGKRGFIGEILNKINVNIIFSWSATVITAVVVSFPLMYKTAKGAIEQIDLNIINAARTMGVSEFRIFYKIILPLAWPGILAGLGLSFARALGEFGATLMLAGNIPGKTQTIPIAIYFAVEGGDMDLAMKWVLVIFTISLSTMFLMNYISTYKKRRGVRNEN